MAVPTAVAQLETAVLDACSSEREWPAQISAGVCAGVDYAIAHPEIAETLASDDGPGVATLQRYESVIARFAGFLQSSIPAQSRLPLSTDEALVAGIVSLVRDHLRLGRQDRLAELRPDIVLLTLLPHLGFEGARDWANRVDRAG